MNNLLNNNNFVRIISVLMAVILWVYVVYQQNPPTERDLVQKPIVTKLSDDLVIKNGLKNVKLKLRGKRTDIMALSASNVKVYLDMTDAIAGDNQLSVKVSVPVGIEIVSIEPQVMSVTLESIEERTLPVVMNSVGLPATGYLVQQPHLSPSTVVVSGPASAVDAVTRAVVDVSLSGVTKDVSGTYALRLYDSNGKLIENLRTIPGVIKVVVPVKKEATTPSGQTTPQTGGEQPTNGTTQDNTKGNQTQNNQPQTPTTGGQ